MIGWARRRLTRWADGLRFPRLLLLTAVLFAADLAIPDLIPFADEILLGLATLIIGRMRRKQIEPRGETGAPPIRK